MNVSMKTVARAICGVTGSALAGPGGALIGDVAGGLLAAALPGTSVAVSSLVSSLVNKAITTSSAAIQARLTEPEKQRINHDLQTAFRDSFGEALLDLGGARCFPGNWKEMQRDVPRHMIFPLTPTGERLWREKSPLADQVCHCFHRMEDALAEQQLLPLDPPLAQPASSVMLYLEAESPQALSDAFFDQVVSPFLTGFGTLASELPDLETHLRRHVLDRTLVHLGEALKHRSPAWRAFNRMMLENLREQVSGIETGQTQLLERLDALLARPEDPGPLAEFSTGLADLMSTTGRIEKRLDEGFDALFGRVVAQHAEVMARFDLLTASSRRIETKVERVLHLLEDGRYVIEGTPSVAVDEPPAPGEPPFKGLQFFGEADADLFFGREMLVAKLTGRLRESLSGEGQGDGQRMGRFLAVVGASGSGKSSIVRAGLIPALKRGEPLADGSRPPEGSSQWIIRIMIPTAHPLQALANLLAPDLGAGSAALGEELARDTQSLNRYTRQILDRDGSGDAPPGNRLLLFVDQFEELFTLCRDESERQAFVDRLMDASLATADPAGAEGHLILIIALRADFYAHCGQYTSLREAVERQQDFLGPMTPDELRAAIEEPARRGGLDGMHWEFERGLVDLILRDVGNEPGALPLLSHALLETWKHRRGRTMTLESYAEAGGVRGAIAKTAETVFRQRLTPPQQAIARNVFIRLTELGEGTQDTRRRAALEELVPRPDSASNVTTVLKTLADARLITTSENTVEIAHEALIREWPTLRRWLDEDRSGLRVHRQLTEAAQEWARLGQDTGAVYRGVRLTQVVEWAEEHSDQLSKLERDFVAFSRFVADRDVAEREAQRRRELESAQRLAQEAEARRRAEEGRAQLAEETATRLGTRNRIITAVGAVALVAAMLACLFAVAAGVLGFRSNQNAARAEENLVTAQAANTRVAAEADTRATAEVNALEQKATAEAASADALSQKATAEAASMEAQTQSRISLVRELASRAINTLERDPDLGLLLAMEAVKIANRLQGEPINEAQNTLYRALETANYARVFRGHTDIVYMATFSPDGKTIVSASQDGTALLWGTDGTRLASLEGNSGEMLSAIFSPDGKRIVTANADGTAGLWTADGNLIETLEGHTAAVVWAIFSPDGKYIVTASLDKTARIWRSDGTLLTTLEGHEGAVVFALFKGDGSQVLTASEDATARLWQIDGTPVAVLKGHTRWINSANFSPDGTRIVTGSFDGTARLWEADGTPVVVFENHTAPIYTAIFSRDGNWILTTADDGAVKLWHADGSFATELQGHSGPVTMAAFSPDSTRIVTAATDNTARFWRIDGTLITALRGHGSFVNTALFDAEGKHILTASGDGSVRLWDTGRLFMAAFTAHNGPVSCADFSPDGERIVSGGLDNTAKVWSPAGELLNTISGFRAGVTAAAFSPDGTMLVTANRDYSAQLWRADGTSIATLQGHTKEVRTASFSPDASQILTSSEDGTARVWRIDGSPLVTIQADSGAVWAASFSPDGTQILTAGDDQTAKLWRNDGTLITTFEGHAAPLWAASFSPDGLYVVTGCLDGSARLWRTDGTLATEITGHTGPVGTARFSPDGSTILTASYDGTIRLWHFTPGTEAVSFVAMLEGHKDWVSAANFSHDGTKIVSSSWDSTIRLWNAYGDVEDMLAEGERRVARDLSDYECQQYLHQETCDDAP